MTCLPLSDAPAAFHYIGPKNGDAFTIAHDRGRIRSNFGTRKGLLSQNRLLFYLALSTYQSAMKSVEASEDQCCIRVIAKDGLQCSHALERRRDAST